MSITSGKIIIGNVRNNFLLNQFTQKSSYYTRKNTFYDNFVFSLIESSAQNINIIIAVSCEWKI